MNEKRRIYKPSEVGGFEYSLEIIFHGDAYVENDIGELYRHWKQHPGYEDKERNGQESSHDHGRKETE